LLNAIPLVSATRTEFRLFGSKIAEQT